MDMNNWFRCDSLMAEDPKILRLRKEFGPLAPLYWLEILSRADLRHSDDGILSADENDPAYLGRYLIDQPVPTPTLAWATALHARMIELGMLEAQPDKRLGIHNWSRYHPLKRERNVDGTFASPPGSPSHGATRTPPTPPHPGHQTDPHGDHVDPPGHHVDAGGRAGGAAAEDSPPLNPMEESLREDLARRGIFARSPAGQVQAARWLHFQAVTTADLDALEALARRQSDGDPHGLLGHWLSDPGSLAQALKDARRPKAIIPEDRIYDESPRGRGLDRYDPGGRVVPSVDETSEELARWRKRQAFARPIPGKEVWTAIVQGRNGPAQPGKAPPSPVDTPEGIAPAVSRETQALAQPDAPPAQP